VAADTHSSLHISLELVIAEAGRFSVMAGARSGPKPRAAGAIADTAEGADVDVAESVLEIPAAAT